MEPWGDELLDLHFAQLDATLVNAINSLKVTLVRAITGKRARTKTYKPKDFMIWRPWKGRKKKKSSAQLLQIVEVLNAALGGKDLRQKKG